MGSVLKELDVLAENFMGLQKIGDGLSAFNSTFGRMLTGISTTGSLLSFPLLDKHAVDSAMSTARVGGFVTDCALHVYAQGLTLIIFFRKISES